MYLLGYVSCTSLTWCRNLDVSEIMAFTNDNKHFVTFLCKYVTATVNLFVNFLTKLASLWFRLDVADLVHNQHRP